MSSEAEINLNGVNCRDCRFCRPTTHFPFMTSWEDFSWHYGKCGLPRAEVSIIRNNPNIVRGEWAFDDSFSIKVRAPEKMPYCSIERKDWAHDAEGCGSKGRHFREREIGRFERWRRQRKWVGRLATIAFPISLPLIVMTTIRTLFYLAHLIGGN